MRINLKIKSVKYAKYVAEFLYKLHPVVLKEQLYMKRSFGKIFGFTDLSESMDYEKRKEFAKLNDLRNEDDEVKEVSINDLFLSSDEVSEEIKKYIYQNYLNDISKSKRKDFINIDFYIEVEG